MTDAFKNSSDWTERLRERANTTGRYIGVTEVKGNSIILGEMSKENWEEALSKKTTQGGQYTVEVKKEIFQAYLEIMDSMIKTAMAEETVRKKMEDSSLDKKFTMDMDNLRIRETEGNVCTQIKDLKLPVFHGNREESVEDWITIVNTAAEAHGIRHEYVMSHVVHLLRGNALNALTNYRRNNRDYLSL